jgi:hypothetical protein
MTRVIAALTFVALFSVTGTAQTTEFPRSPAPITIYTDFENVTSNPTVQSLKAELSDIMDPIGLHFEWRSLAREGDRSAISSELVVVKFKGVCSAEDLLPGRLTQGALGWTHISDGQLLPFSDVDCDRIRQFINPLVNGYELEERNRILGRAMARVLAHELYHIFANTMHHTRGLAKGFYTAGELVAPAFRFEEKEFQALRNNKLRNFLRVRNSAVPAGAGQ